MATLTWLGHASFLLVSDEADFRRSNPRFAGDNLQHNLGRIRDIRGTMTERFGNRISARSAISLLTASRTGMALVPSRSARVRSVTASPGLNMPAIRPRASAR